MPGLPADHEEVGCICVVPGRDGDVLIAHLEEAEVRSDLGLLLAGDLRIEAFQENVQGFLLHPLLTAGGLVHIELLVVRSEDVVSPQPLVCVPHLPLGLERYQRERGETAGAEGVDGRRDPSVQEDLVDVGEDVLTPGLLAVAADDELVHWLVGGRAGGEGAAARAAARGGKGPPELRSGVGERPPGACASAGHARSAWISRTAT